MALNIPQITCFYFKLQVFSVIGANKFANNFKTSYL